VLSETDNWNYVNSYSKCMFSFSQFMTLENVLRTLNFAESPELYPG